jgi:hypothetical protein
MESKTWFINPSKASKANGDLKYWKVHLNLWLVLEMAVLGLMVQKNTLPLKISLVSVSSAKLDNILNVLLKMI